MQLENLRVFHVRKELWKYSGATPWSKRTSSKQVTEGSVRSRSEYPQGWRFHSPLRQPALIFDIQH